MPEIDRERAQLSLTIEWVGHACFRVWGQSTPVLVLDPYTPDDLGVPEITIAGDIVIVSSLDDSGHANVGLVEGEPLVIDALDVAAGHEPGLGDIPIVAVATHESEHHPDGPDPNAMYAFALDGLWVLHMGDVGHRVEAEALAPFAGRCDVLLALAGGGLTIPLGDLDAVIDVLSPRWIIPMHYGLPQIKVDMLAVDEFLGRRADAQILRAGSSTIEIPAVSPARGQATIVVLEPSGF